MRCSFREDRERRENSFEAWGVTQIPADEVRFAKKGGTNEK